MNISLLQIIFFEQNVILIPAPDLFQICSCFSFTVLERTGLSVLPCQQVVLILYHVFRWLTSFPHRYWNLYFFQIVRTHFLSHKFQLLNWLKFDCTKFVIHDYLIGSRSLPVFCKPSLNLLISCTLICSHFHSYCQLNIYFSTISN